MRKPVILVCIVILFVASSQSYAQEKTNFDALAAKIDQLLASHSQLVERIDGIEARLENRDEQQNKDNLPNGVDVGKRIEELQKTHDVLAKVITEKAGKLGPAEAEIKELAKQFGEKIAIERLLNDKIEYAVETINETLGEHGKFLSQHNKEINEAAHQINEAARRAQRNNGVFIIVNKMATDQWILVNRKWRLIPAGKKEGVSIPLPVGTVSTRLPNEELVNWTLGAPSYEEKIEIVPAPFRIHPIQPDSVWRQGWRREFVDGMGWQWVKVLVRRL